MSSLKSVNSAPLLKFTPSAVTRSHASVQLTSATERVTLALLLSLLLEVGSSQEIKVKVKIKIKVKIKVESRRFLRDFIVLRSLNFNIASIEF